ncbi:YbaY family lipoprotein [Geminocystis sp. GBBB08]|uniref:YbaY family lipoprotein n=1 Tax=Geminocystis sp. GBBB08 TaxID=2604140 RepID=UPI0027E34F76|nr:YbaY family lipoprotein [Geminocystis sp. GBBB08]
MAKTNFKNHLINCQEKSNCQDSLISQKTTPSFVTGKVLYQEKMLLPKGSVIEIKLVDISRQDVSAITISEQKIVTNGEQIPFNFKLPFNPKDINPRYTYAIQAKIFIDNQLTFINTQSYLVITRDNPTNIDLILTKVPSNQSPLSSFLGEWLLEDLAGKGVIDFLQTTVTLTQDGKIFGNAGCNNYTGTYQITGNKIKISPLASTRKMCTPAVMDQETKFLQVLPSINTIDYNEPFLFMDSPMREKTLKFTQLK